MAVFYRKVIGYLTSLWLVLPTVVLWCVPGWSLTTRTYAVVIYGAGLWLRNRVGVLSLLYYYYSYPMLILQLAPIFFDLKKARPQPSGVLEPPEKWKQTFLRINWWAGEHQFFRLGTLEDAKFRNRLTFAWLAPRGSSALALGFDDAGGATLWFASCLESESVGRVSLITATNPVEHFLPRPRGYYLQTLTEAAPILPSTNASVGMEQPGRLPDLDALWSRHAEGARYLISTGGATVEPFHYHSLEPDEAENLDPAQVEADRAEVRTLLETFDSDPAAAALLLKRYADGTNRYLQMFSAHLAKIPFRYFRTPHWFIHIGKYSDRPLEQLHREGKIRLPNEH